MHWQLDCGDIGRARLTEPADVNGLVSMDTAKAPMVAIVDHEMLAHDGKRKKAPPKSEVTFPGSL